MSKPKAKYVRFKPDTAFSFDGLVRHCVKFSKQSRVARCKRFKKGRGSPTCSPLVPAKNQRSAWALRPGKPCAPKRSKRSRR